MIGFLWNDFLIYLVLHTGVARVPVWSPTSTPTNGHYLNYIYSINLNNKYFKQSQTTSYPSSNKLRAWMFNILKKDFCIQQNWWCNVLCTSENFSTQIFLNKTSAGQTGLHWRIVLQLVFLEVGLVLWWARNGKWKALTHVPLVTTKFLFFRKIFRYICVFDT